MLFLIPARAGSKRLPGKNKKLFCGLPLWMWSWSQAMRLSLFEDGIDVLVSSDDREICLMAKEPLLRSWRMSKSNTTTEALIKSIADGPDGGGEGIDICLLQPTSPTRTDSLVRKLIAHGGQVRSVTNGKPNGQCYVYRKGHTGWIDIETEQGHDIDTLEDFEAAEKDMMRKFQ